MDLDTGLGLRPRGEDLALLGEARLHLAAGAGSFQGGIRDRAGVWSWTYRTAGVGPTLGAGVELH